MKETRLIMGMPITVEIITGKNIAGAIEKTFDYFSSIDRRFSTYKTESEISRINRNEVEADAYSPEMKEVFALAEKTKEESGGYFDILGRDKIDPSGVVKGWAIKNAAERLRHAGYKNFYVEAGGDIQVSGKNREKKSWQVGIRNPFKLNEIIKVAELDNQGIATSGTYLRGQHIYNPKKRNQPVTDIVSLTVVGPDVLEADRFATAAFAMGKDGINFIENRPGLEGYMIDKDGIATMTSGF